MHIDYVMRALSDAPTMADKSAVGAINRPLRGVGIIELIRIIGSMVLPAAKGERHVEQGLTARKEPPS
jgi:hypothetical protein